MDVVVKSPCRIDLAGGTVDLWPLYLYQGGLELVHMAIDLKATAAVKGKKAPAHKGFSVEITSHDLNLTQSYSSLEALEASVHQTAKGNPLRWLGRLVFAKAKEAKIGGEWFVETQSEVPPGSGLGGSSVLGVSLTQALNVAFLGKIASGSKDLWRTQAWIRDLEACEIEHPAGDQDYVPALFGGLLIFKLGINGRDVEILSKTTAQDIAAHSALLYTGKPHHSGLNNWQVFKAYHEGDHTVRTSLARIREISSFMAQELRAGKTQRMSVLLNDEWEARLKLAPEINAPVLDEAWAFGAQVGASARKACGAGGGGCLLLWFDTPEKKAAAIRTALPNPSWKWLTTEVAKKGGLYRGALKNPKKTK